jgi:hypothetical protein
MFERTDSVTNDGNVKTIDPLSMFDITKVESSAKYLEMRNHELIGKTFCNLLIYLKHSGNVSEANNICKREFDTRQTIDKDKMLYFGHQ